MGYIMPSRLAVVHSWDDKDWCVEAGGVVTISVGVRVYR